MTATRRGVRRLATAWSGAVLTLLTLANVPRVVGWEPQVVLSGSMRPALRPGDVVLLGPTPPASDLHQGQIVRVAPAGGTPYLHRLAARTPDGTWLTRGDANGRPDAAPVAPADLTGVTRLVLPFVGLPYLRLRHGDPTLLLLTALPCLALRRRGRTTEAD